MYYWFISMELTAQALWLTSEGSSSNPHVFFFFHKAHSSLCRLRILDRKDCAGDLLKQSSHYHHHHQDPPKGQKKKKRKWNSTQELPKGHLFTMWKLKEGDGAAPWLTTAGMWLTRCGGRGAWNPHRSALSADDCENPTSIHSRAFRVNIGE